MFTKNTDLHAFVNDANLSKVMLTEFFFMNQTNRKAQTLKYYYRNFPQYFVWNSKDRIWTQRKQGNVAGRLTVVSLNKGECYYLRLFLTHIPAPTLYEDLLKVHGSQLHAYSEAALHFRTS